jgi:hypothetical protein
MRANRAVSSPRTRACVDCGITIEWRSHRPRCLKCWRPRYPRLSRHYTVLATSDNVAATVDREIALGLQRRDPAIVAAVRAANEAVRAIPPPPKSGLRLIRPGDEGDE